MDGKSLGLCIDALRKMRGLSKSELSKLSGVSLKTLWKIEHGDYNVTIRTIAALAKPLGVAASDLIRSAEK